MNRINIKISLLKKIKFLWVVAMIGAPVITLAQKDTSAPVVTIVSSYKPAIKKAAKISFSGTALTPDSSKIVRKYEVPVQNLMYVYQPISVKPLAVETEQHNQDVLWAEVKAGFGNWSSPLIQASAKYGNQNNLLIQTALGYNASASKRQNQQNKRFYANIDASKKLQKYLWTSGFAFEQLRQYRYGYQPELYSFSKDDVSQKNTNVTFKTGIQNAYAPNTKFHYHPQLSVGLFSYLNIYKEKNLSINIPIGYQLSAKIDADVEFNADLTRISRIGILKDSGSTSNNLMYIFPSIKYHDKNVKISAGVMAVSDKGAWNFMPKIHAEYPLLAKNIILQAGWSGRVNKNSLEQLLKINPFVLPPFFQQNTQETEWYGGIKSNVGKHLVFNAKASLLRYKNFALFVNDTTATKAGNDYFIAYEPNMNNFRLHGDVSYVLRDKLNITAGINFNGYTGINQNKKAWNTLPVEFHATALWKYWKNLELNADFYYFAGGKFLKPNNEFGANRGAADLSIAAQYRLTKSWSTFLNLNNIFGTKYERWHNYPVYGFQAQAGICWGFKK
jgi:hypothetical protein